MPTPPTEPDTYTVCDNPRGYKWKRHVCRCVGCRDQASREQSRATYRRYTGDRSNTMVSGSEARQRLKRLTEMGYSYAFLSRYCGVHRRSFEQLASGQSHYMRKKTDDKLRELMKLSHHHQPPVPDRRRHDQVSTDRASRAIQGLMLQGYPGTWIARRLGKNPTTQVSTWLTRKAEWISKENEAALLEIVREVGNRPGPNQRVRLIAQRRGYRALAQWDDLI